MKFFTLDKSTNDKMLRYFVTSQISENIHETPEGYLVCVGVAIARTGEMVYGEGETPLEVDGEGKIIIERSESEVFRPETIASFEGKAVTITHPTEFVSPQNWSRLAKGILQNVRRGEGDQKNDLIADLLITDSVAINLVKNGLREVSCGYEAEYTQTDEGRGVQTNIVGNHLALVDQGRAGSSYAIFDHKGKGETGMTKFEKLLAKLGLTKDSAMAKVIDEALKDEGTKDEEKKDDAKKEDSKDAGAYDELMKMVKDLSEKISGMAKPKDEAKPEEKKDQPKDEEKKDESKDDEGGEASLEDRLKALEAAVAKLLEKKAESGDENDEFEGEESEDEMEEGMLTGDAAARIEILAPGMKPAKDSKAKALKAAYGTKEGKKVIDQLTGGKSPTYDSAEKVETLFVAASELLKLSRTSEFSKSKMTRDSESEGSVSVMSAEKMNEINAKFYNQK